MVFTRSKHVRISPELDKESPALDNDAEIGNMVSAPVLKTTTQPHTEDSGTLLIAGSTGRQETRAGSILGQEPHKHDQWISMGLSPYQHLTVSEQNSTRVLVGGGISYSSTSPIEWVVAESPPITHT